MLHLSLSRSWRRSSSTLFRALSSSSSSSSSSWGDVVVQKKELKDYYASLTAQQYSNEVAVTVGKNLAVTAASGAISSVLLVSVESCNLFMIAMPVAFVGSLYQASNIRSVRKSDKERQSHSYWMHGFMGVTLAPSLIMFHSFIPQAAIWTLALTLGPISAAQTMPNGSLLKIGPALHTCLWGCVAAGLTSICSSWLGYPELANMSHDVTLYGGLALFSVYNAYDYHVMVEDFKAGKADRVGHAAEFSLNMINIFVRLLEVLARAKSDD